MEATAIEALRLIAKHIDANWDVDGLPENETAYAKSLLRINAIATEALAKVEGK